MPYSFFYINRTRYHPEWKSGKWITNCESPEFFHVCYIENGVIEDSFLNKPYDLNPEWEYMMGPPEGTDACPTETLINLGYVGVYVRDKKEATVSIADKVRKGVLAANNWSLFLDTDRVDCNELQTVLNNIASCIDNGVTKGICPFWELTTKN